MTSHPRRDSAHPSASSLVSMGKGRAGCAEHYHDKTAPSSEMRPCVGKGHKDPHYVCETCINTSTSWVYRGDELVIKTEIWTPLCLPCTDAARAEPERYGSGCHCGEEWHCFECRDLVAWQGQNDLGEVLEREKYKKDCILEMKNNGEEIPCNKTTLCPGCETWFHFQGVHYHGNICLACKGMELDVRDLHPNREFETARRTYPVLQGPNWTGLAPRHNQPQVIEEDLAPDELPKQPRDKPHVDYLTANPSRTTRSNIDDWIGTRSSTIRVGAPEPGQNALKDELQIRYLLCYLCMYWEDRNCFLCKKEDHSPFKCPELENEESPDTILLLDLIDAHVWEKELMSGELPKGDVAGYLYERGWSGWTIPLYSDGEIDAMELSRDNFERQVGKLVGTEAVDGKVLLNDEAIARIEMVVRGFQKERKKHANDQPTPGEVWKEDSVQRYLTSRVSTDDNPIEDSYRKRKAASISSCEPPRQVRRLTSEEAASTSAGAPGAADRSSTWSCHLI